MENSYRPQFKRTNEIDIKQFYKHFSERKVPFEDEFIDIWYSDSTFFSDIEKWLQNLYLVTSKGYYIKVSDVFASNSHSESYDAQPYSKYLGGIIQMACCYAYNSEVDSTLRFILDNLKKGKICVSKFVSGYYVGYYHFSFTLPWYSYISAEDRNN